LLKQTIILLFVLQTFTISARRANYAFTAGISNSLGDEILWSLFMRL